MATTLADARQRRQDSEDVNGVKLMVGRRIRCPRCGTLSDLLSYFVFERPESFADQLNVVLKCRAKRVNAIGRSESCRCIFSVASDLLPEEAEAA
jgi:hypothetical protein